MNIVITGSLGNIGRPLTQTLANKGNNLIVITHNAEKSKEIKSLGATPAIGNLSDTNFMVKVFKDANAVFCMIPPDFSQPDQHNYYQALANVYKEAITKNKVKRVVHLSSYGAHLPSGTGFITGSYLSEQILNQISHLQLTHIRPTSFYTNLLAFTGMIKAAGFIGSVYGGEDKIVMVSPRDIADVVAEELLNTGNIKPIRYVTSYEGTCNQVAKILGKAIGIPELKWVALPADEVLQSLLSRVIPENAAKNLVELGEALHSGVLLEDYEKHKPAFGKVTLEQYAEEFAHIFRTQV